MVQESAAGFDLAGTGAVQVQGQGNVGFCGGTLDFLSSHLISSNISLVARMKAAICSFEPMVTRT